jgi:prepilin-type N-terminal cleavage/methylation domain-containing protein
VSGGCVPSGDAGLRIPALRKGRRSAGFTLIELMVVLAILGVMAGVVGLAIRPVETDAASERAARIADARRRALETRRPVLLLVEQGDSTLRMVALPDGSVRADSALGLDALTGRPRARP